MRKLQEEMTAFFRELYVEEPKTLVFGEGDINGGVALIGEAPGEQETIQGRPFVGKAGKNLDEFLALSGLDRKDMYITNVVKFRPVRVSASGRASNRPPTQEEVKLCLPWLIRELELAKPRVVVTLGNVPLKALLGKDRTIGRMHGQWTVWRGNARLYPLYHPASVIYNPSLKEVYREDVIRLGKAVRTAHD